MDDLLLDTCAVIWIAAGAQIEETALDALEETGRTGGSVCLSPISAWELGLLVSRGRMPSRISERVILQKIVSQSGVSYAQMPPEVLIDASYLPGTPPNDPADRIIIATAREYAMTIVTRDRMILNYAHQGHVNALPC
jgi:PIN domain nuclease of toxin-antitoxin system